MKCSKCGKELPEDAFFCSKCGSKINEMTEDTSKEESSDALTTSGGDKQKLIIEQAKTDQPNEPKRVLESPKGKDRTIIYVLLVICSIFLCIKGCTSYIAHKNDAFIKQYAREKYGYGLGSESFSGSSKPSSTSSIQREMEEMVNECNKDLPEDTGFGTTMTSCILEGQSVVYFIEWKGMKSSDFTPDDIALLKSSFIEGLQEETNPILKAVISHMSEYGYKFVYRFIDENGDLLCDISISPDEL